MSVWKFSDEETVRWFIKLHWRCYENEHPEYMTYYLSKHSPDAQLKFKTELEAVDAANNTEFGLASYFYSRDVGRIFRVSEALEYGMVGINVGILATEHVPFGGVKQSGLGREGSHHGMDDYVEIKFLCVGDILK
jgi:hypothetical protein